MLLLMELPCSGMGGSSGLLTQGPTESVENFPGLPHVHSKASSGQAPHLAPCRVGVRMAVPSAAGAEGGPATPGSRDSFLSLSEGG